MIQPHKPSKACSICPDVLAIGLVSRQNAATTWCKGRQHTSILTISAGAMQDEDDRKGGKGAMRELEGREMGKSTSGRTYLESNSLAPRAESAGCRRVRHWRRSIQHCHRVDGVGPVSETL